MYTHYYSPGIARELSLTTFHNNGSLNHNAILRPRGAVTWLWSCDPFLTFRAIDFREAVHVVCLFTAIPRHGESPAHLVFVSGQLSVSTAADSGEVGRSGSRRLVVSWIPESAGKQGVYHWGLTHDDSHEVFSDRPQSGYSARVIELKIEVE